MSLRTVFKYNLPPIHGRGPAHAVERKMLAQGRIIHAAYVADGIDRRLAVWAEFPIPDVEPADALSVSRRFMLVGTGEPIEDGWEYRASVTTEHGGLVHVYELGQVETLLSAPIKVRAPEYGRRADPR